MVEVGSDLLTHNGYEEALSVVLFRYLILPCQGGYHVFSIRNWQGES